MKFLSGILVTLGLLGMYGCGQSVAPAAIAGGGTTTTGVSLTSTRTQADVTTSYAAAPLPAQRTALVASATGSYSDANGYTYPYTVYFPTTVTAGTLYPMYVYDEIVSGGPMLALPSSESAFPIYVVTVDYVASTAPNGVPTLPANWKALDAQALKAISDKVIATYPTHIDVKRIYTGGFSAGGGIGWQAVELYPTYFAAIVTSSAPMVDLADIPAIISAKVGVWMTQGNAALGETTTASVTSADKMYAAQLAAGGNWNYTYYSNLGHQEGWTSDSTVNSSWQDFTAMRTWLFAQHR